MPTASKKSKKTTKKPAAAPKGPKAGRVPGAKANPIDALAAELREIGVLQAVAANMSWDQETMMPAKGGALRAEQMEMLSRMVHERRTSKRMGDLLRAAEDAAGKQADPRTLADLREVRRDYDKARKLPSALVAEMAQCASLGMEAWKHARAESNFKKFLPWLEKTFKLNREKAKCFGVPRKGELYDALLDEYEPDMTAARTEAIFTPLRARLVPLIERVRDTKNKPSDAAATVETPIESQKAFSHFVCEKIGFDFEAGRIDESTHPFCEGVGPGDTRMTNRYRPDGWADALSTATHECGHGMYEQGLPKDKFFGRPLGEAISLGIHESQSRMWENLVARSLPFWKWAIVEARRILGPALKPYSAEDVYKANNLVEPWFIRVESDELTYNLHIMLRFDLERAMLEGNLSCKDLPGAWNERLKRDWGLTVPDDRRGCLQDVHWSMGAVGYFPTYTFGNLYSAQFWEAMAKDIPDREEMMSRGEFGPILQWLRTKIHRHGRQFGAEELCKKITGKPLSADPLMRHLEAKVNGVYG
jgi:carboxypeptidase Taq